MTSTLTAAQRQAAAPALRAAALDRQENASLSGQRQPLQRQVTELERSLPAGAVQDAIQRQEAASRPVVPPPRPQAAGEWVTVMRHRAQSMEGQRLSPRDMQAFTGLQRQVAATLAQAHRQDPRPATDRHASFAAHAVTLQQHALSAPVVRAAVGLVPVSDRAPLQRAVDAALQQDAAQRQQDEQALKLHSLQRHLAELDEQATRPVLDRIQARRGNGNPLPAAVQRHLEQGLNHDLSRVRIHDDAEADTLAKGVNAVAFTTGTDIFFRSGKFNPNTRTGMELLAHEVTHTVQQSQGRVGKGIDPDASLEHEARAMGRQLAARPAGRHAKGPQFGTRARSVPSAVNGRGLQRLPEAGTLQRFGLSDLKNLASSAGRGLSQRVTAVRNAAKKAVVKATRQAATIARATTQKVTATVKNARQQATRAAQSLRKTVQNTPGVVRQYARKQYRAAQKSVQQATRRFSTTLQKAQAAVTRGPRLATQLITRAKNTVQSRTVNLIQRAQQKARDAGQFVRDTARKASTAVQKATAAARATYHRHRDALKAAIRPYVQKAKAKAREVQKAVSASLTTARQRAAALARQTKEGLKSAYREARQAASVGWKGAVNLTRTARANLVSTINTVRNDPRVLNAVKFMKSAGVQVLKVGTAIVVGGAVIAGAAALTAATGGLAGPVLIGALFASGALGGAAATVVGNFFEKDKNGKPKKWNDGITAKSLATDGVLGVVLGPLSKVVGGVVRAAGKPILNVAGKGLAAAGRGAGRVAEGAISRVHPALMPALRIAAASGKARVGQGISSLATLPGRLSTRLVNSRVGQFGQKVAESAHDALKRIGGKLSGSPAGKAFRTLDENVTADLRRLAALPGKAGQLGRRLLNEAAKGIQRPDWLKKLSKTLGTKGNGIRETVAIRRIQTGTSVSRTVRQARFNVVDRERRLRLGLQGHGLNVNPNQSVSARAFAFADRSLASMRNYVTAEARVVRQEVRDQWFGSAGVAGVLRTSGKMQELVTRNPALAAAWGEQKQRAYKKLVQKTVGAMQIEARAAGQYLSRTAARRAATSRITDEMVHAFALRNASGAFMRRAVNTYRAESQVAVTGFDSRQPWLAQLPRMYASGVRMMGQDARDRARSLRQAGSLAAAGATSAGWIGEEFFKTYVGGAAKEYKTHGDVLPRSKDYQAGATKLRSDWQKNVITANTGVIPEAVGGRLAGGAPLDRITKAQATVTGTAGTVVSNELGYEEPNP
ncbi:eCIS core domain-containing protein [Deinococcus ficus]|uniref:eCIS core domain-containing protein n=1 Tax=Deinococcus ficus TaxID=317577 RepID=UPI001F43F955|nr:DUF4157 domain-containing protein [Deinococcus ficus]